MGTLHLLIPSPYIPKLKLICKGYIVCLPKVFSICLPTDIGVQVKRNEMICGDIADVEGIAKGWCDRGISLKSDGGLVHC